MKRNWLTLQAFAVRMMVIAVSCVILFLFVFVSAAAGPAVQDPGPRPGDAGAGGPYLGLSPAEVQIFSDARGVFMEVDSVSGTIEPGKGLGPMFNGNSCAMCHAQPAVGGSSPGLDSPQNPVPNPQVALATLDQATNTIPSFITASGPVLEVRYKSDDGVHNLYTIKGRTDAPGCNIAQPNFSQQLAQGNLSFRIPPSMFGFGLVENTPDSTLVANLAANHRRKLALGIFGSFNTSGNDGTITRFGWKAQNKSILMFAGEAYNVEQGVTNGLFPNERSTFPGCVFNATPEDLPPHDGSTGTVNQMSSDIINFSLFARLSAPPVPTTSSASEANGSKLFNAIGCSLCHSPTLTTAQSPYAGMSNATYQPYSDFALHHMGRNLADGISQGNAGPDQFRTAPLWGIGQRLYFLHDGRTSDLLQAISAHASTGSEANGVIRNFRSLSPSQAQDLLNFLRSL